MSVDDAINNLTVAGRLAKIRQVKSLSNLSKGTPSGLTINPKWMERYKDKSDKLVYGQSKRMV